MDKLDRYRECILSILNDYSKYRFLHDEIKLVKVIDREGDHYQLMNEGWRNNRRYYGFILHFDIKDGKIWIQHNGTENDVATELVELGVAKEDIVLGFHAPDVRKYTGFAVG